MEKDRRPAAQQGIVGQDRQRRRVHAEAAEVQSWRHQQGAQRLLFREVAGSTQGLLRCGDQGGDRQPRGHSEGACCWCAPGEQRCEITAANARRGCARRALCEKTAQKCLKSYSARSINITERTITQSKTWILPLPTRNSSPWSDRPAVASRPLCA